jgi:hypothetical protein
LTKNYSIPFTFIFILVDTKRKICYNAPGSSTMASSSYSSRKNKQQQDDVPSTIAEEMSLKDASSSFAGSSSVVTRSCNAAVQDASRMLHERAGLRVVNPALLGLPSSGRNNTSIVNLSDAPPSKYLLKNVKEDVIKHLEKAAATITSKKQQPAEAGSLSLVAPPQQQQETPKQDHVLPPAPPPPPPPSPQADTSFPPSSQHWTPDMQQQQARRKMVPIARTSTPSSNRRLLKRASSMRSVNSTRSSVSKEPSCYSSSAANNEEELSYYAAGDELASFADDDDYSSDDSRSSIMSELSDETEMEQGGIIAIGIITPPKDTPPAAPAAAPSVPPSRSRLSVEAITQEVISEVVATDIAQEEHVIKMKAKAASASTPGRRLSPPTTLPCSKGQQIGQSIASAPRGGHPRISLAVQTDLQELQTTSLLSSAVEESIEPTPPAVVQPPRALRTRPSADLSLTLQLGVDHDDLSPDDKAHAAVRPSLRARRSGRGAGLSGTAMAAATTNQEGSDRQVKARAAMGAISMDGTSTHRAAVARMPPPTRTLSRHSSIGVRNRKSPAVDSSLEEGGKISLDRRRKDGDSSCSSTTREFTVTSRKPSLERSFSSSDSSTRRAGVVLQRQNSFASTSTDSSTDSGIDLDQDVRDSIILRSSAHARRRRRRRPSRLSQMKRASSAASSNSYMSDDFSIDEAEEDDDGDLAPSMPFAAAGDDMKRQPSQGGRPSDEKAQYRRNPSAGLAMMRPAAAAVAAKAPAAVVAGTATPTPPQEQGEYSHPSRPSDEKAAYRHNPSMTVVPGAHHVTCARREESSKGLQLASGICSRTELVHEDSLPFEPGSVTTRDLQLDEDEREAPEDLEAQAGVPVILPGAFAIDGLDSIQPQHGYDSGFEENSVESGVAQMLQEGSEEMPAHPLDPVTRTVTSVPLAAELYEQVHVQAAAAVPLSEVVEEDSEVDKKRVRMLQGCSCILALTIILGIVLSVILSGGNGKAKNNKGNGGDPAGGGVPTLDGWSQLGQDLLGPTDKDGSQFGYAVSLSGDGLRMAVGLPGRDHEDDNTLISVGAVMIMDFNGTDWLEIGLVEGPGRNAEAGKAIALSQDGSRLAVGAPGWEGGQVTIYEESELEMIWEMVGEPLSGQDTEGGTFGSSIAFSADGTILAVGDTMIDGVGFEDEDGGKDIGNVRVFVEEFNSTWAQLGDAVEGEMPSALFGWSLDLSSDGTRVAASSLGANGFSGSVRVFDFDGSSWIQNGPSIDGEADRENFGGSLSLSDDGSILVVGATGFTRGGTEVGVGRVRAFALDETSKTWDQMGQSLEGISRFDSFGSSVALSSAGDILAIGGPENNLLGENSGHVQVLEFNGSEWIQIGSDLGQFDGKKSGGQYGFSVALSSDGTIVAGGAPYFNFNGILSRVGQVLVYEVVAAIDEE